MWARPQRLPTLKSYPVRVRLWWSGAQLKHRRVIESWAQELVCQWKGIIHDRSVNPNPQTYLLNQITQESSWNWSRSRTWSVRCQAALILDQRMFRPIDLSEVCKSRKSRRRKREKSESWVMFELEDFGMVAQRVYFATRRLVIYNRCSSSSCKLTKL